MPRGILLSRAQHAAIRCEWTTKRPLPEYSHLSNNKLQRQIGASYGFGHMAVGRAIRNSSGDNLDSDDDHCGICIERAKVRRNAKKALPPDELEHSQSPSTAQRLENSMSPNAIAGPSTSATSNPPSLRDIIFVKSDEESTPLAAPVRSTSSNSPRKRKNTQTSSDESDDSDEWKPALPSSHSSKRQRTRRTGASKISGVVNFLKSVGATYLRHVPILVDLGITTRDHLKKIQSMNPVVREKFLARMEQGGLSAMERAIIEDAIMKLPD